MMKNSNGSADQSGPFTKIGEMFRLWTEKVQRAFVEFLTIPSLMIVGPPPIRPFGATNASGGKP